MSIGRSCCARRAARRYEDAPSAGGGPPWWPWRGWTAGAAWPPTGAAGTVGERRLEDALQFGGLVAGQLAAGDFAADQIVDLRLEIVGRGSGAAGLVARPARLQRGIDIGQRRRQRVLVGRTDGAGSYFGLQLSLQLLKRRLVGGAEAAEIEVMMAPRNVQGMMRMSGTRIRVKCFDGRVNDLNEVFSRGPWPVARIARVARKHSETKILRGLPQISTKGQHGPADTQYPCRRGRPRNADADREISAHQFLQRDHRDRRPRDGRAR